MRNTWFKCGKIPQKGWQVCHTIVELKLFFITFKINMTLCYATHYDQEEFNIPFGLGTWSKAGRPPPS